MTPLRAYRLGLTDGAVSYEPGSSADPAEHARLRASLIWPACLPTEHGIRGSYVLGFRDGWRSAATSLGRER